MAEKKKKYRWKKKVKYKRTFLRYELNKMVCRAEGLTSRGEYQEWHKKNKVRDFPLWPDFYYRKSGEWEGWGEFTGAHRMFGGNIWPEEKKKGLRPYWEAVRWAQVYTSKNNVNTFKQWYAWYDQADDIPDDIPRCPQYHYQPDWKGWTVWCGKTVEGKMSSYKENIGVFALANDSVNPGNVIHVIVEPSGLFKLRDTLIERNLTTIAVYQYQGSDKKMCTSILENTCSHQTDGTWLSNNINDVLFEFDNQLERADLSSVV